MSPERASLASFVEQRLLPVLNLMVLLLPLALFGIELVGFAAMRASTPTPTGDVAARGVPRSSDQDPAPKATERRPIDGPTPTPTRPPAPFPDSTLGYGF
jgi:hypothetical protein